MVQIIIKKSTSFLVHPFGVYSIISIKYEKRK